MKAYTIQSKKLDKNRVFILQKSELEKRFDPNTYRPERLGIIEALKQSKYSVKSLRSIANFKKSIVKELSNNKTYIGLENIESNTGAYVPTNEKETISSAIEFTKGQVLFPKLRPYLNKVYCAEFNGICSTEFHILDSLETSNEYLANFLRTNIVVNQTKYLMSGNTLPRLQTEDIESLLIPILPKEKEKLVNQIMREALAQKKHSENEAEKLLASIDDYLLSELGIKMPENTDIIEPVAYNGFKLDSQNPMVKNGRLFLTRFSEVGGGRFDPDYHKKYFSSLLFALEKAPYKKSKLGSHLTEINYGASVGNTYVETGIPLLRIKDLWRNEIRVDDVVYLPESARNALGNCFVKENDFLISRSGTIGVVAIVPKDIENFAFGSFMIKFSLTENSEINRKFLSYYLNSALMQKLVARNKIGAIQGNITIPTIKNFPLVLPEMEKQNEIALHISEIRNQAKCLQVKAIKELEKAKQKIEQLILEK